jgi:cobalt-zinc-cadmium efflux system outer membrane protein
MRRAAIVVVGVLAQVHAVHAGPLTLAEALTRAHGVSPVLAAARADVASARGRLVQAGVIQANPVLTNNATEHRIPAAIGGTETNTDVTVTVGQEVEVGGQPGLRVGAARADLEHAERVLTDHERQVDDEVRKAFAGVVASERRRTLALEAAAESQRLADATASRVAHGDAGGVDLDLARLDALKTRADAEATDVDVAKADARLATAIGADPDERFVVAAPDDVTRETPTEPATVERALAARPDLAAARAARTQLEGQADLTHRTGIIPNPTFRGFYSHQNGHENLLGGEIEVPLPVFNRQQGAEADLRGQAASAGVEVARLEHEIPREVHQALVHHRVAAAVWLRYERDALPAAETARASLARASGSGYLSLSDLLTQTSRLRDTRRAGVDAWLDLREAEADLIAAVGENPW